jgi:cyclopropane-fatty-acyl-phospholipid synthase
VINFTAAALSAGERLPWPDPLIRAAVRVMVSQTQRRLQGESALAEQDFARHMADLPIAINMREANEQHYELRPEFFALMLGPQRKYSCCHYDGPGTSLVQAEERALIETADHAALADGQRILELGCGWGSLSLWMARRFPAACIISMSNSHSQRAFIAGCADREGLRNLTVVTEDINTFEPQGHFDRVVSVEMFEHMSNWRELLRRIKYWMTPAGAFFIHIFSHMRASYRFDVANRADWIAQHFFTGGTMPSSGLIRQFGDLVEVDREWRWDGTHYRRTAEDWLENFDRNIDEIALLLRRIYGTDAALWARRWRLLLHATAGLFGHKNGQEWGVSHFRLRPTR